MDTITDAQIIEALGDAATLSPILTKYELDAGRKAVPKPTIQAWKKRNIPPKYLLRYPKLFAKGRKLVKTSPASS